VIEIMRFRLAPGADAASFVLADRRVQVDFAYGQEGLLRRTTARSEGGEWIVMDLWRSEQEADACADHREDDHITAQFMSFIEATTVRTERYATPD